MLILCAYISFLNLPVKSGYIPYLSSNAYAHFWNWLYIVKVVMSQCSISNREGFNIVHLAGKGSVRLDGLFNIMSYDLVTKLNDAISEAKFKVS